MGSGAYSPSPAVISGGVLLRVSAFARRLMAWLGLRPSMRWKSSIQSRGVPSGAARPDFHKATIKRHEQPALPVELTAALELAADFAKASKAGLAD